MQGNVSLGQSNSCYGVFLLDENGAARRFHHVCCQLICSWFAIGCIQSDLLYFCRRGVALNFEMDTTPDPHCAAKDLDLLQSAANKCGDRLRKTSQAQAVPCALKPISPHCQNLFTNGFQPHLAHTRSSQMSNFPHKKLNILTENSWEFHGSLSKLLWNSQ